MNLVLILSALLLTSSCLEDSKTLFDFDLNAGDIEVIVSDSTTSSEVYTSGVNVDISKSGGSELTKFCISETQVLAPTDTTDGSCGGGNWVTGFPSSFVLSGGDGLKSIYIHSADSADAVSTASITKTITLDTTDPTDVGALVLGAVPANVTTTPTISWTTDGTDNINLAGYQVRVTKVSDSSVEQDWVSFNKGDSVSGLSLDPTEDYQIEIRSIDGAGNTSPVIADTYTTLAVTAALTLGSSPKTIFYQPSGVAPGLTETITVRNTGVQATGTLLAPQIYGAVAHYEVTADTCTGTTLNPGSTCTLDLRINTPSDGFYMAYVYVTDGTIVSAEHVAQGMAYGFSGGNAYLVGGPWDVGTPAGVYDANDYESTVPNEFTTLEGAFSWQNLVGGQRTTCGITSDSKLFCFGSGFSGQMGDGTNESSYLPQIVDVQKNWKEVDVADGAVCAIDSSDDLYCWGSNSDGMLGDGSGTDTNLPRLVQGGLKWKKISGFNDHLCAIDSNDDAYCWGYNYYGQVGDGTTTKATTPQLVSGGLKWKQIDAHYWHTCGITTSNIAYCWGRGSNGRLGNGSTAHTSVPTLVSGGHSFIKVAASYDFSCGLTTTGDLYCWGNGNEGQLGTGFLPVSYTTPNLVIGGHTWTDVMIGGSHTCAIDDSNQGYCWGRADDGQLGNGSSSSDQHTPTLILGGHSWSQLTGIDNGTCGVTLTGKAYCWGYYSGYGQGANGLLLGGVYMPKKVPGARTWKYISAGYLSFCGIDSNDDSYCTGRGYEGNVGNGSSGGSTHYSHPTLVVGGHKWLQLSNGNRTEAACGVTTSNDGYCWGDNYYGQIGSGDTVANFDSPNLVIGGHSWTKINIGEDHTCGIRTDGSAYCWGVNRYGQFGNGVATGDQTPIPTPTAVSGGLTFSDIGVGKNFSCGLTTAGEIYCWGEDLNGRLGDDISITDKTVPTKVAGGGTWASINIGRSHGCALRANGDAYCWGQGINGATGLGSSDDQPTPGLVIGGITWSKMKSGEIHTCGLEAITGNMYCFGFNNFGQIGAYQNERNAVISTPRLFDRGIKFTDLFLGSTATYGIIDP